MTETKNELNIYQRLHAVMKAIDYVQKEDKKVNNQYRFVSHDAVTAKCRKEFVENRILTVPCVFSHECDGNKTILGVTVDFINIDKPDEKVTTLSYGYGIDPQDKGIGKAYSYAVKYAYLKVLGLETGDDPERDNIDYQPKGIENAVSMSYTDEQLKQSKDQLIPADKVIESIEKSKNFRELKTIWVSAYNARKEYGEFIIGNIQKSYNDKKAEFMPKQEEQDKIYNSAISMISKIGTLDKLNKYTDENDEIWQSSLLSGKYADIKQAVQQARTDITRENNQRNGDLV